jgi:hypothetical protein
MLRGQAELMTARIEDRQSIVARKSERVVQVNHYS